MALDIRPVSCYLKVATLPQRTKALPAALLLFALLGTTQCKLRDTSGYCRCEKICPLKGGDVGCVATNDPRYGCASASCDACAISNASATCDQEGRCAIGGCDPGFADCDGDVDGCETDYTTSTVHCGGCFMHCPGVDEHAESSCNNGLCSIDRCLLGYKDCNHWYPDGCETEPDASCDTGTDGTAGSAQGE